MNTINKRWHRLIRWMSRNFSKTVVASFLILGGGSLFFGYLASIAHSPETNWFDWFDSSLVLLGWFSMALGWALALYALTQRLAARLPPQGVGKEVREVRESFDASVILASKNNVQPEWHLTHVQPRELELLWTPWVQQSVKTLLEKYEQYRPKFGPDHAANGLSDTDSYEIDKVREHCIKLIKVLMLNHRRDRVCVDLTAGNTTMTLGAFLAAEEMNVTTIYLLGNSVSKVNGSPCIDQARIDDEREARVKIVSDHRDTKRTA